MNFDITGRLIEKFPTQEVTASFRKREFVLETTENFNGREFSETIKFQLTQDRCEVLESFSINEDISVRFNIKGRKWEKDGKVSYFNNLEAWKIERVSNGATPPPFDELPPELMQEGDDLVPF
jgi:hypothetical protein